MRVQSWWQATLQPQRGCAGGYPKRLEQAEGFCHEVRARHIVFQPVADHRQTSHPQVLLAGSGEFNATRGGAEQEALKAWA